MFLFENSARFSTFSASFQQLFRRKISQIPPFYRKNRSFMTGLLQRKGAKRLIHEKVGPRNHTKLALKVYPRNWHEKFIHERSRIGHETFVHEITRNWHERFIHETGTKSSSTKQARKVHPRKVTNRTLKGFSAYLAPPSRVPLHLRFLYSLCSSIPSAPLFPLHLCSYSPPSTKGRQSGTKGMFDNECFLHLIN